MRFNTKFTKAYTTSTKNAFCNGALCVISLCALCLNVFGLPHKPLV